MKRSYDYSFVDDTDDTTATINHSLDRLSATPATHTTDGFYTGSQLHSLLHSGLSGIPTLELRVPLLPVTGPADIDSDFQSNAGDIGLLQSHLQASSLQKLASAHRQSASQLTGLGICYDDPSFPAVLQDVPDRCEIVMDTREESTENSTRTLSLDKTCHIHSPKYDLSEELLQTSNGNAYSEYPSQDFMAHAPSLLFASISSLPSLLYLSSSEDSSTENIKTISLQQEYQDLLESPTTNASHRPPICEPVVGIYADVNLREVATRHDLPQLAIDPAILMGNSDVAVKTEQPEVDTLADVLRSTADCSPALVTPSAVHLGSPDFSKEAIDAIVTVLSRKREDTAEQPTSIAQMPALSDAQPQSLVLTPVVGLPQPINAPFGEILVVPPPPLFTVQGFVPMQQDGRVPLGDIFVPQVQDTPQPDAPAVDHRSPVLNAHLGVELDDLRQRADGFRARNPGRDIDKNWLQSFAGRLSSRGELIDDYRCYVNGCSQTNRRRDHILVHVGSHVEYRPFTCSHCGMRFLRKNECKRHESSHGGLKPFHCELCGQGRSFVRQDLLKRHMRVTHGVQSAPADRRKRLKVEGDGYWP